MEHDFWHDRWDTGRTAFHEGAPNALLVRHFDQVAPPATARVFLPLCGKTRDIAWLRDRGLRVAGAELSELAIRQLFEEIGQTPEIADVGRLKRYSAPGVDMFVGDIFDLTADLLGPIDLVYDRAALVALPHDMRPRYAAHLAAVTASAPQFLITFEYDQSQIDGPPFSVDAEDVRRCHGDAYAIAEIAAQDVPGGLKGVCPAVERVWRLERSG